MLKIKPCWSKIRSLGLANVVTLLRIFCIPGLVFLAQRNPIMGVYVFVGMSVSDGLDGWLARKISGRSRLGTLLDPIADKLLSHSMLFWCFANRQDTLLLLSTLILLIRDVSITKDRLREYFSSTMTYSGRLSVSMLAKCKSALLFFSIVCFMLVVAYPEWGIFWSVGLWMLATSAFMSIYAWYDYHYQRFFII